MSEFERSSSWLKKFHCAFRGVALGIRGQSSFRVHIPVALLVLVAAGGLGVSLEHWIGLVLCIGLVMTAELFNSSLEAMARAVDPQFDPTLGRALDIAGGLLGVPSHGAAPLSPTGSLDDHQPLGKTNVHANRHRQWGSRIEAGKGGTQ